MAKYDEIDARIGEHVRAILGDVAAGKGPAGGPPPGKGQTWGSPPDVVTRVGRYPLPDGRYYADAYYPVDEAFDDDFGSRSCVPWCRAKGSAHQHCHRVASTLAGLLEAATVPHSAPAPATA